MPNSDTSVDIHDHGTALGDKKRRIQCRYCRKVVAGFHRLKSHLGHQRGDVTPCGAVPLNVMELFKKELLETTIDNPEKEPASLDDPDISFKRNRCSNSNTIKHNENESIGTSGHVNGSYFEVDTAFDDGVKEHISLPKKRVVSETGRKSEDKSVFLPSEAEKSIARFFYETGIDFSVANTPSFQKMINATIGRDQVQYKIPNSQELKGWILENEVTETREYIQNTRNSWTSTGCSILVETWTDEKGLTFVIFLADCPQGAIYLQSSEISSIVGDIDALQTLLDGVIEDVGVNNVIQVVSCFTTGWLGDVGKQFMDRCSTIFWTVSASHCIELMLEKIMMMDSVSEVLNKAKVLTKFIHGHATILKLLKSYTRGCDLIKPSTIKSAMAFMTLENIVSENHKLESMFASSEWKNSPLSSTKEGEKVAELIEDLSFWEGASMVLKAAVPLVQALCLIRRADEPQVGYIYETMDQVKETIQKEFKSKKPHYMPFWNAIDDIWNPILHSPLHAAGYYLNPSLFYSTDFYSDAEVSAGLLRCIIRIVQDKRSQELISVQLSTYIHAKGAFEEGSSIVKRNSISPAIWWLTYGNECPQLQNFAVRILSQTCDGALRFGLKRSVAEKLLTDGMNSSEERRGDLTFVHYNLQLQQCCSGIKNSIVANNIDPMDDWIVPEELACPV